MTPEDVERLFGKDSSPAVLAPNVRLMLWNPRALREGRVYKSIRIRSLEKCDNGDFVILTRDATDVVYGISAVSISGDPRFNPQRSFSISEVDVFAGDAMRIRINMHIQ